MLKMRLLRISTVLFFLSSLFGTLYPISICKKYIFRTSIDHIKHVESILFSSEYSDNKIIKNSDKGFKDILKLILKKNKKLEKKDYTEIQSFAVHANTFDDTLSMRIINLVNSKNEKIMIGKASDLKEMLERYKQRYFKIDDFLKYLFFLLGCLFFMNIWILKRMQCFKSAIE